MKGRVEDIEISAIEHPLFGVCVTATHFGGRTISQFDNFMPKQVSIEDAGKLFVHIIGQIRPEKIQKGQPDPPPAPQRKRPSKEEAFRQAPGLLRELFRVVDEFEFLFSRPFTPDGHVVGSIGEAVAAYVYDLELLCGSSEASDLLNAFHNHVARFDQPAHVALHNVVA